MATALGGSEGEMKQKAPVKMKDVLRDEFRKLARVRSYMFDELWKKTGEIVTRNMRILPVEFYTGDLWHYARKRGWTRETRTGRIKVTVR